MPSTSTSTAAPGCSSADFVLGVVGRRPSVGIVEVTLAFRNTAATTCPLAGYPGVQLLDAAGVSIPTDIVLGGTAWFTDLPPSSVNVAAGAEAYFNIGYSDTAAASTSCPTAAAVEAVPPHLRHRLGGERPVRRVRLRRHGLAPLRAWVGRDGHGGADFRPPLLTRAAPTRDANGGCADQ